MGVLVERSLCKEKESDWSSNDLPRGKTGTSIAAGLDLQRKGKPEGEEGKPEIFCSGMKG